MTMTENLYQDSEGYISNKQVFSESFFELQIEDILGAVNQEMKLLNISEDKQLKIKELLEEIHKHNVETYMHSIRVGLLASRIGSLAQGLEQKPLLQAGLLHDYGKTTISNHLLNKKKGFNEKDYKNVQNHVLEGYKAIVSHFLFSAEIVVRHHQFNAKPYPEEIPQSEIHSKKTINKINTYSRIVALADFYDALNTRNDGKYGDKELSNEEKKGILIRENYDMIEMIAKMDEQGK